MSGFATYFKTPLNVAPDLSILTLDTMNLKQTNLKIDCLSFLVPSSASEVLEVPVVNFSFPRQTCVIYVGRQIEADSSQTVCVCV